jgi:hypothetical protein
MDLKHVEELQGLSALARSVVPVAATSTLSELIAAAGGITMSPETEEFVAAYHKRLAIVNPTKAKFRDTVMDQTYYDLLRLFTNQLEKENCVLIAAGFSFADEHLCELVCRACDSNPTMKLIVYAHTSRSKADLEAKLKTSQANIVVVAPPTDPGTGADVYRHTLEGLVHKVFRPALALMAGPADNDRSRP